MTIIRKVVLSALFVGILAGIFLTLIQSFQVNAIILEAEQYETDTENLSVAQNHAEVKNHHETAAWLPRDGTERVFFTAISNIFAATGFALLLISFMGMAKHNITWLKGGAWGLAGFVTFFLAPSIGLPPEIPGTVSAGLLDRQLWWMFAVIGTGSGIAVLAFAPGKYKVLGLLLVVLPQIIGAPGMESLSFENGHPQATRELQALAEKFYPATTFANAVYWLFLGVISSLLVRRFVSPSAATNRHALAG